MASNPASGASACKYCGGSEANVSRQYLSLQPLCLHELPQHIETASGTNSQQPALAEFINSVLTEAYQANFDDDTWTQHGKYPPAGTRIDVIMPPLSKTQSGPEICVPVEVNKRAKGKTSSAWLGRKSYHDALAVDYLELDTLLAQDHCRKEYDYTPSVFDANELLKWDAEDLKKAVAELNPEWRVKNVQMSIFQMFHEMPKALGVSMLQHRVFHVLCITAHSTYTVLHEGESSPRSQSYTVQLPVNLESFRDVESVMLKSHIRARSRIYEVTHQSTAPGNTTQRQVKSNGRSLTEGIYVSLERLCQAPSGPERLDNMHRWDMMTQSDAKGITRAAPWSTKRKEILEAVAKDVQYILEQIRRQRQDQRNIRETTP